MKRVMLICPDYMGLYEDIAKGLQSLGFYVHFVPEKVFSINPNIKLGKQYSKEDEINFEEALLTYWKDFFSKMLKEDMFFDYVFVIDGLSFHPYVLEQLKIVNPKVEAICYMFDRIKGVYQIDYNFKYFNRVYSFDLSDSSDYNIEFLPIYWVPEIAKTSSTVIFGMGAYDPIREKIYKRISRLARKFSMSHFIKMYYTVEVSSLHYLLRWIKSTIIGKQNIPSPFLLKSDLITNTSLSTTEFRQMINSTKVVIDTNHPYQDGLTARFMWALGARKKIITNNYNVDKYDFYTKDQILVIKDTTKAYEIIQFISEEFDMPDKISDIIDKYRIDNWLKTILAI